MQNIFFSRQNNNLNRQNNMQTTNVTNQDLQNLTTDIISLLTYINQLNLHIYSATSEQVKNMLTSVRNDSQIHLGELMSLLFSIDPNFYEQFQLGLEQGNSLIKRNA